MEAADRIYARGCVSDVEARGHNLNREQITKKCYDIAVETLRKGLLGVVDTTQIKIVDWDGLILRKFGLDWAVEVYAPLKMRNADEPWHDSDDFVTVYETQ